MLSVLENNLLSKLDYIIKIEDSTKQGIRYDRSELIILIKMFADDIRKESIKRDLRMRK